MEKAPCIYGENFSKECPVRREIRQRLENQEKLSKIKQDDSSGMGSLMANVFEKVMPDRELQLLPPFCQSCPIMRGVETG